MAVLKCLKLERTHKQALHFPFRKGLDTFPRIVLRDQTTPASAHLVDKSRPSLLLVALRACSSLRDLDTGKRIHDDIQSDLVSSDLFVATALVDMFAKCGRLSDARGVFDSMHSRDVVSWNALILGYVLQGEEDQALELFTRMEQVDGACCSPDARTLVMVLKACTQKAEKEPSHLLGFKRLGMEIHSRAKRTQVDKDAFVASALVDMYSRCRSMEQAVQVFQEAPSRDVVMWTALLLGYVYNGEAEHAVRLFHDMKSQGCSPNARTFTALAMACTSLANKEEWKRTDGRMEKVASLERAQWTHAEAAKAGFTSDLIMANCMVDMFSKCGGMEEARQVFDRMSRRSVVSWTSLILGYVENEQPELAIRAFERMDCSPNARTFVAVLSACSSLAATGAGVLKRTDGSLVNVSCLEKGVSLHKEARRRGFDSDIFVANTLIDMYGKSGCISEAYGVFKCIPEPDVVSWTALILGYVSNGESETALELYAWMKRHARLQPNARTYVAALTACTSLASAEAPKDVDGRQVKVNALERARSIHRDAEESSCIDIFVTNTLISLYSKCGSMREAQEVFEQTKLRLEVVSWNALITGYAENGEPEIALSMFSRLNSPDSRTFVGALMAYSCLAARETGEELPDGKVVKSASLEKGMSLHSRAAELGLSWDLYVGNSLIGMYSKCGSLLDARMLFDRMDHRSSVTWTCMINSYVENGESELGLQLFAAMEEDSPDPDSRTFLAALAACSCLAAKETGDMKVESLKRARTLHLRAVKCGYQPDGFLGNSLIGLYADCRSMSDARSLFESMAQKTIVSWSTLLLGYVDNGAGPLAMQVFERLVAEGPCEDLDTRALAAVLMACGSVLDCETGRVIHAEICRRGGESSDAVLANNLIDFYGKCGKVRVAQELFDSLADVDDTVSWNALITGYSHQGDAKMVIDIYERMLERRVQPNGITFVAVLTACSRAGLVERGKRYFQDMVDKHGLRRSIQHYSCVVDMLGRANLLEEAVALVRTMPYETDAVTWTAVLGACCKWDDGDTGRLALENLKRLRCSSTSYST